MKKIIKDNLKFIVVVIITSVVTSVTSIFAYSLLAENVGFTPKDTTWNVQDVEAALNNLNLRTKELTSIYTFEEIEVGRWTDGKKVYQKVIKNTSLTKITAQSWTSYADVSDLNIESVVKGHFGRYRSDGTVSDVMNDVSVWYNENNGYLNIWRANYMEFPDKSFVVIQYTKTTD